MQKLERVKNACTEEDYLLNTSTVNLFKMYFSKWIQRGGGQDNGKSLSPSPILALKTTKWDIKTKQSDRAKSRGII